MSSTALANRIKTLAEELAYESMPIATKSLFSEFETTGNRVNYEKVYFTRRKFLSVFGLVNELTDNTLYSEKLNEVILDICREITWALPAHCNTKQKNWQNTVDLFSCETAASLALIITRNKKIISDSVSEAAKRNIKERVTDRFTDMSEKFGFLYAKHNWNAVCCGSLGIVFLLIGDSLYDKKVNECALDRINSSLKVYAESFPKDGVCLEGVGYFNYGLAFYTAYAKRLYEIKGISLFDEGKLKAVAMFPNAMFFNCGRSVNFSDSSEYEKVHRGILEAFEHYLGVNYTLSEKVLSDFDSDTCYRYVPLLDDLEACNNKNGKYGNNCESASCYYLKDAEWVICNNPDGTAFAIKGGCNDEPHNHNDVGSYIYIAGGETIACEIGAGEYTKEYFGSGRYNILCNSSEGHSLPVTGADGFQISGKEAAAKCFKADISELRVIVSMDLSMCYKDTLSTVKREAVFDRVSGELCIKDEIETINDSKDRKPFTRIISRKDITNHIELSDGLVLETCKRISRDHAGNDETIWIYDIREDQNEYNNKRTEGRKVFRFAYRLHP